MPRIDDYIAAKRLAVKKLAGLSLARIGQISGLGLCGADTLRIPFLNRIYRVAYPEFDFVDEAEADKDVPLQEQVLILHYLMAEGAPKPAGKWVAYREIPGAQFYFSAFAKRAIEPLKNTFGRNPSSLQQAARQLEGVAVKTGDAGFEFQIFPKVPLQLILWVGDDEFPSEANILFDETIREFLSPEDVAWMAGMLVYRLIALSR
ncbi:MAG: DUF3786 domain-containing protein [Desulfobacterales bacterium]|jgi:hypothetical protein